MPHIFAALLIGSFLLCAHTAPAVAAPVHGHRSVGSDAGAKSTPMQLELPGDVTKLHIDIGPNSTPLTPPASDSSVAVLAIEPNIAVAHHLRETLQKRRHASRLFVLNCAVAGAPLAGRPATFRYYNERGMSSSLGVARRDERGRVAGFADRGVHSPTGKFGPGASGVDFVPVLSLGAVLQAVPGAVDVEFLKMDAQGFDLEVVKSAGRGIRRVRKIQSETYLPGVAGKRYEGVRNELERDWIPYMTAVGYRLVNPTTKKGTEYDAVWVRND